MGRKRRVDKRTVDPDPKFNDAVVTRFITTLMRDGKKSIAEGIFYRAMEKLEAATSEQSLKAFKKALENVKPVLEVKSRRVGGATYQVPVEVKPARRQSLAVRWIIDSSRARPEHNMTEKLAAELTEAFNGRGGAMKKREDVHRMADANKAFAHFRW
ncbi:MAG TPA: 30S ribosomal protein S7 [Bdellovibrionota bacterium]|jgi:small subunit ribosomal protein S7|nr:30S ribosomal protein S7 [Bdellovibrionota bacterium]